MKKTFAITCALLACLLLAGCAAQPQAPAAEPARDVTAVEATAAKAPEAVAQAELANLNGFTGSVQVQSEGETIAAYEGMRLFAGDTLRTGEDSTASLDLDQGRLLMLGEGGELQLIEKADGSLEVYLTKGTLLNEIAKGQTEPYTVRTANVTMGVLGTVFSVSIDDVTGVSVTELYEGKLLLTFSTLDGQEHSFELAPGRRFTADAETMEGSAGENGLITEDIYLDDLSPKLLDMLQAALRKREDSESITEVIEQIEALLKTRAESGKPRRSTARVIDDVPTPLMHDAGSTSETISRADTASVENITPVSATTMPVLGWFVTVSWDEDETAEGYAGYTQEAEDYPWYRNFIVRDKTVTSGTFHLGNIYHKIAVIKDLPDEALARIYAADSIDGVLVRDRTGEVDIIYEIKHDTADTDNPNSKDTFVQLKDAPNTPDAETDPDTMPEYGVTGQNLTVTSDPDVMSATNDTITIEGEHARPVLAPTSPDEAAQINNTDAGPAIDLYGPVTADAGNVELVD